MSIEEVIEKLEEMYRMDNPVMYGKRGTIRAAIEMLEKQIPKKVVIKPWSPAKCPTCGDELSESLGGGYYKHYRHLDFCHNKECLQKLDWGENDE